MCLTQASLNIIQWTHRLQTVSSSPMAVYHNPTTNQCRLSGHCRLKGVLWQAMQAYLAVLDSVTLADLMAPAAAGGAAARALLPTVALPQGGGATRRRAPVAGLPSKAENLE